MTLLLIFNRSGGLYLQVPDYIPNLRSVSSWNCFVAGCLASAFATELPLKQVNGEVDHCWTTVGASAW